MLKHGVTLLKEGSLPRSWVSFLLLLSFIASFAFAGADQFFSDCPALLAEKERRGRVAALEHFDYAMLAEIREHSPLPVKQLFKELAPYRFGSNTELIAFQQHRSSTAFRIFTSEFRLLSRGLIQPVGSTSLMLTPEGSQQLDEAVALYHQMFQRSSAKWVRNKAPMERLIIPQTTHAEAFLLNNIHRSEMEDFNGAVPFEVYSLQESVASEFSKLSESLIERFTEDALVFRSDDGGWPTIATTHRGELALAELYAFYSRLAPP